MAPLRYLLLQVRDPEDPMRRHEVLCFANALRCAPEQIAVTDLMRRPPEQTDLAAVDVVLLGGSGDYSVAEGGTWLETAMHVMRDLHATSKPTFASCWGHQAMARAMGGVVVTDASRAEVGTHHVVLTPEGEADPVMGMLPKRFRAQMGHEDSVIALPEDAIRLASTDIVENQAFCFDRRPIYCTQFHPELDRNTLLDRMRRYPKYVERILGIHLDEFIRLHMDEDDTKGILERFVQHVFGPHE